MSYIVQAMRLPRGNMSCIYIIPGRKKAGEMLRSHTFSPYIPFFPPRAVGVVRLAAPRFLCAAPFFRRRRKKNMRRFSVGGSASPQAKKKERRVFGKMCLLISFLHVY